MIAGLAALVIVIAGGPAAAEPIGRIDGLLGEARILRAGQDLAAAKDALLQTHDHLGTGPDSRLRLILADGSRIALGGQTTIVVDSWQYRPEENLGHLGLRLVSGSVLAASGGLTGIPGATFLVRTPTATIAIRGTEFWAGPIDGQFGILLLDGRIALENTAGKVELTEPGTGVFLPLPPPSAEAEAGTEPAGAWTMPGAPPVAGGPASATTAWDEDLVSRALRAVSLDR